MFRTACYFILTTLMLTACDLPDETDVDGCHVRLTGINLHETRPFPWVTAITSGAGCKTLDWSRIQIFSGPADALNVNNPAVLSSISPLNNTSCKMWQWSQVFTLDDWYLMGTVDGVAEFDLSSDDIPVSGGVLPAYRWKGQPWTLVLFGGPECPGAEGPSFPDPCPPSQCGNN